MELAGQRPATLDLRLKKTPNLAAQLSNGEWMASVPGTDQQKGQLLNCVGCHTLERVLNSTHDADAFTKTVLPRMQGYVNQSIPPASAAAQSRAAAGGARRQRVQVYRATAEYLATINLSEAEHWDYPLKTLPRPTGRATRVVYHRIRPAAPTDLAA